MGSTIANALTVGAATPTIGKIAGSLVQDPQQISAETPEQAEFRKLLLGILGSADLGGALQSQLDPEQSAALFQQTIGDPARERFRSDVIPSILQASANLGSKGGSSLERQLGRSAQQLETGLARQQAGFQSQQQQQGIGNLLGGAQLGLGGQPVALQAGGLTPQAQAGLQVAQMLSQILL